MTNPPLKPGSVSGAIRWREISPLQHLPRSCPNVEKPTVRPLLLLPVEVFVGFQWVTKVGKSQKHSQSRELQLLC